MNEIAILADYIKTSDKIVIFSGAGMSVPSGIPDFRSASGIYSHLYKENLRPENIISHSFYENDPETFFEFYWDKLVYADAQPNYAHMFFKELEATKHIAVVTQNIDGLDKKAGLSEVYELHGSIWRNYCEKCHHFYPLEILKKAGIPHCTCGGIIKPDVVLYEENLDENVIHGAIQKISECDLLIVIGTSLSVYPAVSFINYYQKDKLVIINKTKTAGDIQADLVINADVVEVLKEVKKYL